MTIYGVSELAFLQTLSLWSYFCLDYSIVIDRVYYAFQSPEAVTFILSTAKVFLFILLVNRSKNVHIKIEIYIELTVSVLSETLCSIFLFELLHDLHLFSGCHIKRCHSWRFNVL